MEERRDNNIISRAMIEFSNFIEEVELFDPSLLGGVFTWTRSNNSHIAYRLDRFLFSSDWDENFRNIRQSVLPKPVSEHTPILLNCGDGENSKSYFKFQN